jgi:hypothetical protein
VPVVIDDLDVEVESGSPAAPAAVTPPGPPRLAPDHLDEVARHLAGRRERVRAD